MERRKNNQLCGLSFVGLRRSSTTTTPPGQYVRETTPSRSSLSPSPCKPSSPTTDTAHSPILSLGAKQDNPLPFVFTAGTSMVREQEPARNPLMPSQAKGEPRANTDEKSSTNNNSYTAPGEISHLTSPRPEFGRPTALNASASPLAKASARISDGQRIRKSGDKNGSSHLFARKRPEPTYHKPPSLNPLQQFGGTGSSQQQSAIYVPGAERNTYGLQPGGYTIDEQVQRVSRPATISKRDDDVFEIQKPANFPAPAPRPAAMPFFSSNSNTNPYFRPASNFVDLTKPMPPRPAAEDEFNDRQVFGNDPFGTADPMMYMDAKAADEHLKGLLEGALEDDDNNKPRTRRKKKELEAKVNDLTKQMKGMDVKSETTEQAEDEEEEDDGTREGLKVKLLPHQIDGVEWMLNKELGTKKFKGILPKGGILADDMGLGKTIQAIALILSNPRPSDEELQESKRKLDPKIDRATLVVAPLALIKQWEKEIADRVEADHALEVRVHHGPQRTRSYKDLRKYDVVITTYQTLSSEHVEGSDSIKTALFGVNWYRIVLDEAHSIKNRNAKSTKAACALSAEYRWCLTGTPMQNNPDELQSLIHFLRIKPYSILERWREEITKPLSNGRGGLAIRRLRTFLSAFMKRRTKDVLKQEGALKVGSNGETKGNSTGFKIVKRTVETVEAEFNAQERAFYQRLQDRTEKSLERMMAGNQVSYASALVLLLRLRQACNHPQLLGGDLSKEQEMIGDRSPSKKSSKGDDIDDIANMLGSLSVETKQCDICLIELSKDDIEQGLVRCAECEEDMQAQEALARRPKCKKRKEKKVDKKERKINRRLILDSDGEDEETQELAHESATEDDEQEPDSTTNDEFSNSDDYESALAASKRNPVSSTKIRHLLKILKHDSHTHKYIVFSVFTSMLDLIEPFLKRHNLKFVRYDGSMRNEAREASLDALRSNPSVRILLCSLKAGSLGLNLTAASRVVVLEPFWNPFVEEQAIDRVHRLNQTQDVVVHKLTIKDSVEERILALQEKKRELAKATIEGQKGVGAGKLTVSEMLKLFKHDGERDAHLDMLGMKDGRSLVDQERDSVSTSEPVSREASRAREQIRPKAGALRREDPVYGRRW